jgi:hypothetical protein
MLMGGAVLTCHSIHMTVAEKYLQAVESRHQTPLWCYFYGQTITPFLTLWPDALLSNCAWCSANIYAMGTLTELILHWYFLKILLSFLMPDVSAF